MSYHTTDFINDLLLSGGEIKTIHDKINERQKNMGSKGYKSTGYFFNKSDGIQQRTLFGHIAHLAIDELSEIKFGELRINETLLNGLLDDDNLVLQHGNYQELLREKYEKNEFIQLIMFRGVKQLD